MDGPEWELLERAEGILAMQLEEDGHDEECFPWPQRQSSRSSGVRIQYHCSMVQMEI
jgi:hypothetical protein